VPADGRDVVLLHGVIVSSRYMVPLALELGSDFRVHAPDLPGFGLSDGPDESLDVGGLADALLSWMDSAGLQTAALVANSFGCHVAVEAVARRPARFDRLVLQGPAFDPHAAHTVALALAAHGRTRAPSLNAILARDLADCGPSRALATIRHALADRVEPKLSRIEVPTLVVRGGPRQLAAVGRGCRGGAAARRPDGAAGDRACAELLDSAAAGGDRAPLP
jgi:pimeloyl-ACP methyl ester carboxylesterase